MAYEVFISYRRAGGEALAYLINEKLTQMGYHVFYDIESLAGGRFDTKLLEVIDSCEDVVVVLPPNALDRCNDPEDWLRIEVSHAIKAGKNLIPVMMKGFEWPKELPEDMAQLPNYNGEVATFEFFDGFIQRLQRNLLGKTRAQQTGRKDLKHVLFWSDFDHGTQAKIIKRLALDEGYYVEELVEPVEMLSKPLEHVYAIVLIDTDVTKLSNNDLTLSRINQALVSYVEQGGRLICTHDLIYRRTRNEGLQNMYGCRIKFFEARESVRYYKTDECKESGRFASLPDEFVLHDDEICWGDVAPDVDVYFETEDGRALVFGREYGNGMCLWLNPGDYKEFPPRSILKPEKEFVALLRETLTMEF